MKALLDTNLIIPAEPTSPQDLEVGTAIVVEVIRLLNEGGHQIYLHPASLEELAGDQNLERRAMRATLLEKYPRLPAPPPVPAALERIIGSAPPSTHDAVDHALLAAVHRDAVGLLVTADHRLHNKAARAQLSDRVFTPEDCVVMLRGLFPRAPSPLPAIVGIRAHELDESDPIFESFRGDYPGFDAWLRRCKLEHRQAWAIRQRGGRWRRFLS